MVPNQNKKYIQINGSQIEANYGRALQHKGSLKTISKVGIEANILDLGGGERRLNLENFVNLDGERNRYVTIIADAHFLPFKDMSFDLVICEHLLEHVKKPWIVANEIYRITKEKGLVYIEVPFLTPYHGRPHHYFNMTKEGIEQIFERFRKIESGVQPYNMPSSTIILIFSRYLRCLFPFLDKETKNIEVYDEKSYISRKSVFGDILLLIYKLVTSILTIIDKKIDPKKAEEMATAIYYIGTR